MNTGSCSTLERVLLPKRRASCQTRTHETAMSTISVWDIGLGDAVMGVTRRRDGFRHSSDERSNAAVAVCPSYWQKVPQGGANNLRSRLLATMIFSAPAQNTWRFSAMPDATVFTAVFLLLLAHAGSRSTSLGPPLQAAERASKHTQPPVMLSEGGSSWPSESKHRYWIHEVRATIGALRLAAKAAARSG